MDSSDEVPLGKWLHAFEDDHDDVEVYRRSDAQFPRARRVREGLELHSDGTATTWVAGPGDALEPVRGSWRGAGPQRITVEAAGLRRRLLRVSPGSPDRLEVRSEPQ